MTFCNTPESLRAALDALSGPLHVLLDCEGHTLGGVGGKLSLLNLGVVQEEDSERHLSIFLIDILAFQGSNYHHLVPIFDIMRSETVFKVMFDGRMDASELLHGHGVQLKNVLDLQVADILSREKRGESIEERLGRLVGFLRKHEITQNRALYLQVQKLNGLDSAMEEHGVAGNGKGYVDHSKWLQRPLEKSALQYAAEDIQKICLLYYKFVEKGYIDQKVLARQSASYITLHEKDRPNGGDRYNRHGLLPLALLTEMPSGTKVRCRGCTRDLSLSAFVQENSTARGHGYCFVCRAVDAKANTGGKAYFHTYEDLDYDEGFDDILDYSDGLDDLWDESFYHNDY